MFRPQAKWFGGDYRDLRGEYSADSRNVSDMTDFIRSYRLLEKDLVETFDYVEPTRKNYSTYSHRFYQLLMRACTEFEANAKAILQGNGYTKKKLDIRDYWKLNRACRLSDYGIINPVNDGPDRWITPFGDWKNAADFEPLSWYQRYNEAKHNRIAHFEAANLLNVLNAVSAGFVMLFAQFGSFAFHPYHAVFGVLSSDGPHKELMHEDSFFQITLPTWPADECYDFEWETLKREPDPFRDYPFVLK